jgi:hypothetical protein
MDGTSSTKGCARFHEYLVGVIEKMLGALGWEFKQGIWLDGGAQEGHTSAPKLEHGGWAGGRTIKNIVYAMIQEISTDGKLRV